MKAIYCQQGETLDYIPVEDIENGAVVNLGTRIGITAAPIHAGEQGAIHMTGVFSMTKTAGEAIEMGADLYYDPSADAMTATADKNIPAGYAAAPAASGDSAVLVKL